jgi:hypothetical protein
MLQDSSSETCEVLATDTLVYFHRIGIVTTQSIQIAIGNETDDDIIDQNIDNALSVLLANSRSKQ